MIRRKLFASMGLVFGAIAIVASSSVTAFAATTPATTATGTGNALRVSPVRNDLEIKPGASQTIDIYVQNLSNADVKIKPIVNDFVANKDESGSPSIILDENKSAPIRSFKQYVSPLETFTVKPNEQHNVKVTITIPANADAGGYFGAVRFTPADSDSGKTLSLSASVGSLVLVRVPGDLRETANIASLDVRKDNKAGSFFTSGKDLTGVVRIENTGNVQVQPFGKVIVKKSGKVMGSYEINDTQPRGNVLPDSIRRFEFGLDKLGSFGKYTLEANLGYGTKGQLITASSTFYIVPVSILIITGIVVLLILFAIFVLPRMIKSYNNRVVQKATGTKKKK